MRKQFFAVLLTLATCMHLPIANADDSDDLSVLLIAMQQVSADFVQTIKTGDGELIQAAMGSLHAQRPAKLRWSITAPDEQLIVVDGEKVWRFEADLEQVTVENFNANQQAAPSILLSGDVKALKEKFTVSKNDDGYILSPKDESSLFVQMTVRFSGGLIAQLQIIDGFEQTTNIEFSNVDITTDHDADLYKFTPPQGVDILRND